MRANRNSAVNGLYNIAVEVVPDDADTSLPAEDLRQWKTSLANLPAGDGSVAVAGRMVTISVQWNEARDGSEAIQQFQTQSQL
jgi:type IV pilus assembly protein PilV